MDAVAATIQSLNRFFSPYDSIKTGGLAAALFFDLQFPMLPLVFMGKRAP
jgi:hypothetical protein